MMAWAAAAVLGVGLAALEARRADRRHLTIRIVAVLVAVASLAAIVNPPMLPSLAHSESTAMLVTPGTSRQGLDRLRQSLPGVPVYNWPDSVTDLATLRMKLPGLRTLHVTGWGLRESTWLGHDDLHVTFHPDAPPAGVTWLAWPRTVRLGETFEIAARTEPASGAGTVWLQHPDGHVDSLSQQGGTGEVARFRTTANAVGEWVYVLGGAGVAAESVHVAVLPARPPAVLILGGAPAFETTFLRRWLADQGASVAVRTRLARDQYRTERTNLPGVSLATVTTTLLESFDLVMLDGSAMQALAASERSALDRAVREDGLGIYMVPDSLARRDRQRFPFRLTSAGDLDERTVRPLWSGQREGTPAPVPALPDEIAESEGVRPLMRDPAGRVVAATYPLGAGTVGTSMVSAPSRWLIDNEPTAFADYWSAIIAALARNRSERWALAADGPPAVDLALSLALVTSDSQPHAIITRPYGTVDTLGLARDPAEPRRWWGRYWPLEAGWHHATTNEAAESYPFYVSAPTESALEATARLMATARRVSGGAVETSDAREPARRPLSPLFPFLALVLATGLLWGEGRSRGSDNASAFSRSSSTLSH